MAKRYYVNHKNYNGNRDTKFVMATNDFRLTHPQMKEDYEIISTVDVKRNEFKLNGKTFKVFSDWSVKLVG